MQSLFSLHLSFWSFGIPNIVFVRIGLRSLSLSYFIEMDENGLVLKNRNEDFSWKWKMVKDTWLIRYN